MRKRVAIFTPNPGDATSFYRAFGVFSRLRELYDIDPIILRDVNWASLAFTDLVYAHRPDTNDHVNILKMAKFQKKKIWADYDDDLLNVPEYNPSFNYFQKNQNFIKNSIGLADVVTVTTAAIKEAFSQFNDNIHVVPNAIDERIASCVRREKTNPTKIIVWRGSNTHERDLFEYKDQIINVMKERPDWKIFFMGMIPWFIVEHVKKEQVVLFESMDILHYFELIGKISPDVMIVPLHDDKLNRGKSNIAYLEGVMAGAVVVSPAWDGWHKTQFSYEGKESFEKQLLSATSGDFVLKDMNEILWKEILNHHTLDVTNKKRAEIFENLVLK